MRCPELFWPWPCFHGVTALTRVLHMSCWFGYLTAKRATALPLQRKLLLVLRCAISSLVNPHGVSAPGEVVKE